MRGARVDVISVPAGHPYVRHVQPGGDVVVRPDPDPDDPTREARGRWWPPVALDPVWLAGQDFDLLHLHFGYDGRTPAELTALADLLDATGRPLVLTVHDLRNPHHADPRLLDAQLDVLVPRAAALVTLTGAAADQVERRWGRRPHVVPHPHVVDLDEIDDLRARRTDDGPRTVGLAVKELRRNTDPLRLLPTLVRTVRDAADARLRVTAHHALRERDDEAAHAVVAALDRLTGAPGVDVVWHEPWSDAELYDALAALHVAVLPYRFGTHSGWLEACHDVGTRVLAPSSGCYGGPGGQGADGVYAADEDHLDEASLAAALGVLLDTPALPAAGHDAAWRRAQREQVTTAHRRLYDAVLAREEVGA